jgi:hypothetical protein
LILRHNFIILHVWSFIFGCLQNYSHFKHIYLVAMATVWLHGCQGQHLVSWLPLVTHYICYYGYHCFVVMYHNFVYMFIKQLQTTVLLYFCSTYHIHIYRCDCAVWHIQIWLNSHRIILWTLKVRKWKIHVHANLMHNKFYWSFWHHFGNLLITICSLASTVYYDNNICSSAGMYNILK